MSSNGSIAIVRLLILRRVEAFGAMVFQCSGFSLPRLAPLVIERIDDPGLGRCVSLLKRATRNRELHVGFVRRPGGVAEWEIGKDRSRYYHRFGDRPRRRNRRGNDAFCLECSCDQSN